MPAGQVSNEHPLFHRYTDIQNLRNFPDKLKLGNPVVVTEKLHGTNSRIGLVRNDDDYELVIGTHRTQRKVDDAGIYGLPWEKYQFEIQLLFNWAKEVVKPLNSVILFGEIYGAGVQDLHYGQTAEKGYRAFDVAINGEYMNFCAFRDVLDAVGIPRVPELGFGVYDLEDLLEIAEGDTTLDDTHIREGIVVRPAFLEDTWGRGTQAPTQRRMIFKVISGNYLARKGGTEHH
jgi:RNA ligase (TIGR02306 family)